MTLCLAGSEKHLRAEVISAAIALMDAPTFYLWGGKDLSVNYGLDCSGAVAHCLSGVGVFPALAVKSAILRTHAQKAKFFRENYNADRMWREFGPVDSPQAADLAFYGTKKRATHVMFCVGDGRVIGASGGGPTTTSITEAKRIDARVKVYPSHLYRKDFIGFRQSPFPKE